MLGCSCFERMNMSFHSIRVVEHSDLGRETAPLGLDAGKATMRAQILAYGNA